MTTADEGDANRQLLARLEALEQRPLTKDPQPFWKNTALVGFMGASIAVVPPLLTAIHEYYQTEREVRLSVARYQHERTISYLDRALSPETKEAKQAQVFRFLRHLPEDDPIHQWAKGELNLVEGTIEQLKQEVQTRKDDLAEQEAAIKEELDQIEGAVADADTAETAEPLLRVAQIALAEKNMEAYQSRQKISALEVRAGLAPETAEEPSPVAPSIEDMRPRLWKLRIAIASDLRAANNLADRARARGAKPEIRKQGEQYWVLVGTFGTQNQARDGREAARKFLLGPVAIVDITKWCSSGTMRSEYFECDPPMGI